MRNGDRWWHKQLRIIQYNLQMKDTPLMNAERIACETEEMGGNVVVINVSDSVVWYRTAVHFQKINPYLPKGRDLLEELIEAFHKHGIKVIARGAFMGFEEETYYQKPEWARRRPDGSPVMLGNERPGEWFRLYSPCPNSGFISEGGGLDLGREAFSKYDLDGAFWCGDSSREGCWCDKCKKLYFEKYGEEMPKEPEKIKPDWNYENGQKLRRHFLKSILEVKPDMPFIRYYWPFDVDLGTGSIILADNIDDMALEGNTLCTEAQDVLSKGVLKLPEWNTPSLRMKMGRTIKNYPPPIGIIHTCPGMDWRHTCMPEAELLYWAAQIPACGGSYWTTLTGFADTISDKRILKTIGRLNRMMAKIEDDMYGANSDCQIMLLSDGGVYVQGWSEALMCCHMDFDMLAHYQFSYERIRNYPVVILPADFKYPKDAGEILKRYVEEGGRLIVEGTRDAALAPVKRLLGVEEGEIVSSEELAASYLRIEPSNAGIQEKIGACQLVPLRGKVGYSHAKDSSLVLATWIPSFASVATAGFPPERASLPISHTDIPLCVVSSHGKGRVMFLPYEPSRMIREYGMKDMFTMIEGYVDYMLGKDRKIRMKAPGRVLSSVFAKEKTQMIHLINGIGQRPLQDTVPCYEIRVFVSLGDREVVSVDSRIAGEKVEWECRDRELQITLPRLEVWDMLRISYK